MSFDLCTPPTFTQEKLADFLSALALTNYKFSLKTSKKPDSDKENQEEDLPDFLPIKDINCLNNSFNLEDPGLKFKLKTAECVLYARTHANRRGDDNFTGFLLDEAQLLATQNPQKVKLVSYKGEQLVEERLNLLYSVGKGSKNPPLLINLTYLGAEKETPMVAMVGKGVVFDAGGLNIKPTGSMETMYMDKSGACAVLAAFKGAVELGLKVNLTCTLAVAENFISGNSYRPSDIITSRKVDNFFSLILLCCK